MKIADTKFKKAILLGLGSVIITVTVIILLISPIAKYLIEKYGEKYTGRHIKMSWIYINPFTGYVHISNLKIWESKKLPSYNQGDSIFFAANGVSASFALRKLLSKTFEISSITLDQPKGTVIQNKKFLNFTDLIDTLTPKKPSLTPSKWHFNILTIKIENSAFYYREDVTPINYFIKEANFESTGKRWNSDSIQVKFSFKSGTGSGTAQGTFMINFKNQHFRFAAIVHNFDMNIIEQYMKALVNYGSFRASLDADVTATGDFNDEEDINAKGIVAVNDFHFGKNPDEDYASWEKLTLKIDSLSPKNHVYNFDSLSVIHPYFKYERYDSLDNLQMMFGKNGSNLSDANSNPEKFNLIIQIAQYVKVLVKNFFESDYKINRLAIYKADIRYNDYAISEKFTAAANPLTILADSINKQHKRVNVKLTSGIQPYGNVLVTLSIDPKNKGDFDLYGQIQKIPVTMFNPYLISYSSYNLDRGTLEFKGTWNVRNGMIQSVNHLVIIDSRVTKRLRNKDTKWLPMPLIMSLVRERGNVIDYEIPITGNMKNPKFHLHDVLVDLIENIFVKPATTPYRLEVKNMEAEIEKSHSLKWKMRQGSLLPNQEKFVGTMADFLVKNPDATIAVYPMEYTDKEKEQILFFEAKKKYFLLSGNKNAPFLKEDSLEVDKKSVKESLFVHYLNKTVGNSLMFTIQEKCTKYIGTAFINTRFKQLNKEREEAFMAVFKQKGVQDRVIIHTGENNIPYNGFSFYKIVYKGEIPESLAKAYQKMNELNEEAPRKQYKSDRKKARADLKKPSSEIK
jgi:hypothetical protein